MHNKEHYHRVAWTLADQGAASLGTFLASVLLARYLPLADYGVFALVFSGTLTLQLVTSALIFYPMSIRSAVVGEERRAKLLGNSLILLLGLCAPLCLLLVAVTGFLGRGDIIGAVLAYFLLCQVQEMMRRGLLAEMRQQTALLGDSISYLGQVAAIGLLIAFEQLSLSTALYAMAATSGIAALIQFNQLDFNLRKPLFIMATLKDFCSLGMWSLGNNLTMGSRLLIILWILTALYGPATAGLLQAGSNIVNLANPIILGLCNIIPQTAAKAHENGKERAWLAIRPYTLIGAPPIIFFYILLLVRPEFVLHIVYGEGWPAHEVVTGIRLLAFASMLGYAGEMICSYLHGVDSAKLAFFVNGGGLLVVVLSAFPLILAFGLNGACASILLANATRTAASRLVLTGVINNDQPRPA